MVKNDQFGKYTTLQGARLSLMFIEDLQGEIEAKNLGTEAIGLAKQVFSALYDLEQHLDHLQNEKGLFV